MYYSILLLFYPPYKFAWVFMFEEERGFGCRGSLRNGHHGRLSVDRCGKAGKGRLNRHYGPAVNTRVLSHKG